MTYKTGGQTYFVRYCDSCSQLPVGSVVCKACIHNQNVIRFLQEPELDWNGFETWYWKHKGTLRLVHDYLSSILMVALSIRLALAEHDRSWFVCALAWAAGACVLSFEMLVVKPRMERRFQAYELAFQLTLENSLDKAAKERGE